MTIQIKFIEDLLDDEKLVYNSTSDLPYRLDLIPGSAQWLNAYNSNEIAALDFVCPCGCGAIGTLVVRDGYGGPRWQWNGDLLKPTLKPSIWRKYCGWHGYLTRGIFHLTSERI